MSNKLKDNDLLKIVHDLEHDQSSSSQNWVSTVNDNITLSPTKQKIYCHLIGFYSPIKITTGLPAENLAQFGTWYMVIY